MKDEKQRLQQLADRVRELEKKAAYFDKLEKVNRTFFAIASAVSTSSSLQTLYPEIHRYLSEVIDTTNFYIAIYDEESNSISFPYNVDVTESSCDDLVNATELDSLTARVILSRSPLMITGEDILELQETSGERIASGVIPEIWLGVPLIAPTRLIGAMVVQSYESPNFYDNTDIEIMNAVAAIIAMAIERKQFEQKLADSLGRFRKIMEEVDNIAIQGYDEQRKVIFWNRASTDLYGYSPEAALGQKLEDLIIPQEMRAEVIRLHEGWLTTGRRIDSGELVLVDKSGNDVPVYSSHVMEEMDGKKELYCIDFSLKPIKEVEAQLRAANAQFKVAMDSLDAQVYVQDMETCELLFVNEAVKRVFGATEGGLCWKSLQNGQDEPCSFCTNDKLIDRNGQSTGPYVWEHYNSKNGEWYQCRDQAIRWPDGRLVRLEIAVNITNLKLMENQLRESEERFRALHDASFSGICIHRNGVIIDCNNRFAEIIGYSRDELIGMNSLELVVPDLQPYIKQKLINPGHGSYFVSGRRKDGSICEVEMQGKDFPYKGEVVRVVEIRDVTESRKALQMLEKSELRHRVIFENSPMGMVYIREDGRIYDCNDKFLRLLGLERADINTFNVACDTSPFMREATGKALKGERAVADEFIVLVQGQERHLRATFNPVTPGAASTSVIASFEDVTQSKIAEQQLKDSAERFRTFFSAINDAVMVHPYQPEGFANFIEVNDVALTRYGYSRDEFLNLSAQQLNSHEYSLKHGAKNHRRCLIENGHLVFEAEHMTKSGEKFPVEISANIIEQKGRPVILSVVRDISERKKAEKEKAVFAERLMQAEKLESIGRLAGGVAHDFNNMLGVILGRTEMVLEDVDELFPHIRDLEEIHEAATRSAELTRQLLTFARRQAVVPKIIDLNAKIGNILLMVRRLIGESIELDWKPAKEVVRIRIDPGQVDQLLTNLSVNSRDAIAGIGKITISTQLVEITKKKAAFNLIMEPGEYVSLTITDTGAGIEEDQLEKIFEPFYTTKDVGEGTGLGLATVFGIVAQNNGFIEVENRPGQGASFILYFPRCRAERNSGNIEMSQTFYAEQAYTVLVVEDEKAILDLTCIMLTRLGYNILAASTPEQAVLIAKEHPGEIDLLLTDIIMPQMDGQKLANKIQSMFPEMKCLYMSGYSDDIIARSGIIDGTVQLIQKPFTKNELSNKVQEIFVRK